MALQGSDLDNISFYAIFKLATNTAKIFNEKILKNNTLKTCYGKKDFEHSHSG